MRRPGVHTFLFIMPIAFVTPFMHCAICWLDDIVCSRSDTASMCDFILYIFLMYARVLTRSFAMIFAEAMFPSLACFLMSLISFFSCRSSALRSRSSSRTDFLIERL